MQGPMSTTESKPSSPPDDSKVVKLDQKQADPDVRMLSFRELSAQLSAVRSRLSILDVLVTHLETHYMSVGVEEPEETIIRDDQTIVPQAHLLNFIELLQNLRDTWALELDEIENLQVPTPVQGKDR